MVARLAAMLMLVPALVAAGPITFRVHSAAFAHTAPIPARYTCDGKDVSPPLEWGRPPPGTKRIAIVAEDPTVAAGSFVHWALYDLPGSTEGVPEGVGRSEKLRNGARQVRNDFATVGYRGPCPPPGKAHQYWFRVYALDGPLALPPRPTGREVLGAMSGHVVRVAEVMGTFAR